MRKLTIKCRAVMRIYTGVRRLSIATIKCRGCRLPLQTLTRAYVSGTDRLPAVPDHAFSRSPPFSACGIVPRCRSFSTEGKLYDTPTDEHVLLVIQPEYKTGRVERPYVSAERKLEEAVSLAEAISGWSVHTQRVDAVRNVHSKTFFGKGKITELKQLAGNMRDVTGIFLNVPRLTPVQHGVLERMFKKEIFDRFGVILRIFKERARTKEAKLQVALAEIPYLRTRLTDTHTLGEEARHVAAKRNVLQKREVDLRKELKSIRERRQVMGVRRKKHHLPVIAVVGYTNTGKTTLIKALSKDESMHPKDMLFATLDTTMHAGKLPCGQKVLYVDTIGFVSDLPHELVESFSSTLDDVTHADVLLHVRDMSHPQSYSQKADVMKVLSQLDLTPGLLEKMLVVGNKMDRAEDGGLADGVIPISALHGTGLDDLLHQLEHALVTTTQRKMWKIILAANGPQLSWLYQEPEATVCDISEASLMMSSQEGGHSSNEQESSYLSVKVILTQAACSRFQAKFSQSVRMIEVNLPHTHKQ